MDTAQLESMVADITTSQAKLRPWSPEEVVSFSTNLKSGLKKVFLNESIEEETNGMVAALPAAEPERKIRYIPINEEVAKRFNNPADSITSTEITCLACGNKLQVIRESHLKKHKLTAESYCERFGLPQGTRLACSTYIEKMNANGTRLGHSRRNAGDNVQTLNAANKENATNADTSQSTEVKTEVSADGRIDIAS